MIHNVISVSGGKDSTATLLLALERETPNLSCVFADTGHEHHATYDYLDYLEQQLGVTIQRVRADFSARINKRRQKLEEMLLHDAKTVHSKGWLKKHVREALKTLYATGNPFLDLCIWKGRFPSMKARFCTDELKVIPIQDQVIWPLLQNPGATIESWQGIRWDESKARSTAVEREGIEPDAERVFAYRPILSWSAADVFEFHRRHGIKHNPLYEQGMGRVGCMPCINCRKGELQQIATRFPEVVARLAEWERIVSSASRLGSSTFFAAVNDPTVIATDAIAHDTHGIARMVEWSSTARGGRQFDLVSAADDGSSCSSLYGLCEAAPPA